MLEVVGQDIISGNMGFIGTDPDRLYRIGAAEKTEDVTVTGNPAVLDNATGKPFRDLHIYGWSEQMTTTGAQLLDLDAIELAQGTGATIKRLDDGGFLVDGTPKGAYEQYITKVVIDFAPGTYFVSGGKSADGCVAAQVNILNADGTRTYRNNASFDILGTEQEITLVIQSVSKTPINNYKIYPMINSGSVALPFEPYTGGKPSPSPDYPQEVRNAAGNLTVRGKNLYNPSVTWNTNGWVGTLKKSQDKVTITAKNGWMHAFFASPAKGETVTISCTYRQIETTSKDTYEAFAIVTSSDGRYPNESNSIIGYQTPSPNTIETNVSATFVSDTYIGIFLSVDPEGIGLTRTVELTNIQLEYSSKPTSYEPYHEPQSMSVTTPNGLPGIPVSSGGNYTDENGQRWICDEVDFGRGVYMKRVYTVDIAELEYSASTILQTVKRIFYKIQVPSTGTADKGYCTRLTYSANYTDDNPHFYINEERVIVFVPADAIIKPKEYLVQYVMAAPIETPLTASEIAAYKSLRTYKGTTIVEAEDKAGISATYKRSAKTDNTSAERKIEESEKKEYDES